MGGAMCEYDILTVFAVEYQLLKMFREVVMGLEWAARWAREVRRPQSVGALVTSFIRRLLLVEFGTARCSIS
jgi:hypothetical protein